MKYYVRNNMIIGIVHILGWVCSILVLGVAFQYNNIEKFTHTWSAISSVALIQLIIISLHYSNQITEKLISPFFDPSMLTILTAIILSIIGIGIGIKFTSRYRWANQPVDDTANTKLIK